MIEVIKSVDVQMLGRATLVIFLTLGGLALSTPQAPSGVGEAGDKLSGAAQHHATSVQFCHQLLAEDAAATLSPDVAYKPGVDVQGTPVVPADIDGAPPLVLPDSVTLPLEIDARRALNLPSATPTSETDPLTDKNLFLYDKGLDKVRVGTVELHLDGRVFFNGQPLVGEQRATLRQACQNYLASQ